MSTTTRTEILTIHIPLFGDCTLLPVSVLPENLRSYEKLLKTAEGLGLQELRDISRREVQEVFKSLSFRLLERGVSPVEWVSVILSGTHDAYPLIHFTNENQETEKCVTCMQFFFWKEVKLSDKGVVTGGPADMRLDEIPMTDEIFLIQNETIYCLFLGT